MKLTQCDVILKTMLEHPYIEWWKASDFQHGEYFVGYEATARMSDLIKKYKGLINIKKDGRFRLIGINWNEKEAVNEALSYIASLEDDVI